MRIAEGLEMLELTANVMGGVDVLHPALLWDKEGAILVDTGYPGLLTKVKEAMEQAGVPFDSLQTVILTHQDLDHIGSLPDIVGHAARQIEVLASILEKPHIQGDKMLIKHTPEAIARAMESMPEQVPEEWRKAFRSVLENPPKEQVHRTLGDGDVLPRCGGVTVIHTPGHTPGHMSLYHQESKTLIAGDAMIVKEGRLLGPDPEHTLDMKAAAESLNKLTRYDIETVVCYHGGLYEGEANLRIAELAKAMLQGQPAVG